MRLINTSTLELQEFYDEQIPKYAILSHTWGRGGEEVSFDDMKRTDLRERKAGYDKVKQTCALAMKQSLDYAWIDTCCIDKSSSSELSEAINSMFRWYQAAEVCFAFLSDVPAGDDAQQPDSRFRSSRWFSRGWTLQELLAPRHVEFYDATWSYLGTKTGALANAIQAVTHIPADFLGVRNLGEASVANRMAWASQRQTTRQEDVAYCLLGIFGINMPLVYGEGANAFWRLQLEILKETGDESILAWERKDDDPEAALQSLDAFLAKSPADFSNWRGSAFRKAWPSRQPYEMTNMGLRIYLPVVNSDFLCSTRQMDALLNCTTARGFDEFLALPLRQIGEPNQYRRLSRKLKRIPLSQCTEGNAKYETMYLTTYRGSQGNVHTSSRSIYIRIPRGLPETLAGVRPKRAWRPEWQMIVPENVGSQIHAWQTTVLHFGPRSPPPDLTARNVGQTYTIVLGRQTFWNALWSPRLISPLFRPTITRPQPQSAVDADRSDGWRVDLTSIRRLWAKSNMLEFTDPERGPRSSNRVIELTSMTLLGKRFDAVELSHNVVTSSFPERLCRHFMYTSWYLWAVSSVVTIEALFRCNLSGLGLWLFCGAVLAWFCYESFHHDWHWPDVACRPTSGPSLAFCFLWAGGLVRMVTGTLDHLLYLFCLLVGVKIVGAAMSIPMVEQTGDAKEWRSRKVRRLRD